MLTTHQARPVNVYATKIARIIPCLSKEDPTAQTGWCFEFEDGSEKRVRCDDGMLARLMPAVGDYLVTQEDGYEYFNPREVFERKYVPLGAQQS